MLTLHNLRRDLDRIKLWLVERGAQVLVPTNEWEVLRYQAGRSTGVVYRTLRGTLTFVGGSREALTAFYGGGMGWTAGVGTTRQSEPKRKRVHVMALLKRDGDVCFYCGKPLGEDITREHLVPLTAGGPDHIANMFLSHSACNFKAGALSAVEKIKLRDALHAQPVKQLQADKPAESDPDGLPWN